MMQMRVGEIEILHYDTDLYPFSLWFEEVLGTPQLSKFHEMRDGLTAFNLVEEANTIRRICESRISGLQAILNPFMEEIISPLFSGLSGWQLVPTIRVHWAILVPPEKRREEAKAIKELAPEAFLQKYYF